MGHVKIGHKMTIYSEALSSCSSNGKRGFYQQVNVRICLISCFTWINGQGKDASVLRNGPSDFANQHLLVANTQ